MVTRRILQEAEGYPDTFVQPFRDLYGYIAAGDFKAQRSFPTFETGHYEVKLCESSRLAHGNDGGWRFPARRSEGRDLSTSKPARVARNGRKQ